MNIFHGSIHRLLETAAVWDVEGSGAQLIDHPIVDGLIKKEHNFINFHCMVFC